MFQVCLHSALIDEVVATFTLTMIEARGKKTIKPFLASFLSPHSLLDSSLLQYVHSVLLSLPYFFSLSVRFNELLCWHDSCGFMCFLAVSFTLCCSSCYRSSLLLHCLKYPPPPPNRPVSLLSNLGPLCP